MKPTIPVILTVSVLTTILMWLSATGAVFSHTTWWPIFGAIILPAMSYMWYRVGRVAQIAICERKHDNP